MTKKALFDLFVNGFDVLHNSEVTKENLELLFGENVDVYDLGKEDNDPEHYQTDIEKGQALMRLLYLASCQYRELIDKYNEVVGLVNEYNDMIPDDEEGLYLSGDEPEHWSNKVWWDEATAYFSAIPDDEEFCCETLNKYSLTKKDVRRLIGSRCDFNNLLGHPRISQDNMRLLFGHIDVDSFKKIDNEPDHYSTTIEKGQALMRGLFVKSKCYDAHLKEFIVTLSRCQDSDAIAASIKATVGEIQPFNSTGLQEAFECFDCIPDDVPFTMEYIK